MGMITTTKTAAKTLQSLDDAASKLPAPGSRDRGDGVYVNVCGDCGAPTEGPATRYRCTACGKTADEYKALCVHVHDVTETKDAATYPATDAAVKAVDAARAKPSRDRSPTEAALASATVSAEPEPKPVDEKPTETKPKTA
jgi:hypothetical protein